MQLLTAITDSILNSVKAQIGLPDDYTPFDAQLIYSINTALFELKQIGLPTKVPAIIEDEVMTWADLIDDTELASIVSTCVYLKVKTLFDPPTSSIVANAMKELIREMEFRISATVDRLPTQE